jgi:demethylmenaquinone methyltransferase/2-methoxy-6-polyprenyl-1,4-benzoquinol methylase
MTAPDTKRPWEGDQLPQGEAKVAAVREMFDAIAPRYDLVNRIMTFRLDVGWRRACVDALTLPAGSLIGDLCCGTGDLCAELATRGMRAAGFDLSMGMLLADHRGGPPRVLADVLRLPLPDGSLDGAVSGFGLRNLVDLGAFFDELGRVVRPGGRVSLLEVATPPNRLLRAGHGVYFGKVVPLIGGIFSDRSAYAYLPRSVAYLPPPAEMLDRLRGAGFHAPARRLLSGGIAQLITATRA